MDFTARGDMSRKQANDTTLEGISVVEEQPNDQNNTNDDTNCNTENKNRRNTTPSKYKMINKEKRKKVLFWGYLAICFLAIGLCVASFSVKALQEATLKGLRMWQWCLLIAALLPGPLLSYAIIKFILLFIDRDFSIRENVIYYVVELGESAAVVLWFSMILVAWLWVMDEPRYLGVPQQDVGKIKQIYGTTFHITTVTLTTLILGSFLWLIKDLVLMKAKSSFHIRRFFDRIKEALLHQYVIEGLSKCLLVDTTKHDKPTCNKLILMNSSSKKNSFHKVGVFRKEKRLAGLSCLEGVSQKSKLILMNSSSKKNSFHKVGVCRKEKRLVELSSFEDVSQENVSCWGMKILIQEIINNPYLTYKVGEDEDGRKEIDNESEATNVAKSIISRLPTGVQTGDALTPRAPPLKTSLIGERELLNYFQKDKLEEVMSCLLGGAHSHKQVDAYVFQKWMVKVYKYRKALNRALDANKNLFKTFNRLVDALLVFLIFALWLIMLRVETRKVIYLFCSALVGCAFIFGETSKKLLENILFVFVVHPFDIGDCCLIDNTPVIIEDIDFLTTTVLTFENEMKHYPNAVLSSQPISNYTRSPRMGDFVTLSLDIDTPIDKINSLKGQIKRYIDKNEQCWRGEHHWVMELEDISTLKMTLHILHTINYHELFERQIRKTEFVLELKKVLNMLGLTAKSKTESGTGNDAT